ncbi:MAG: RNA polymerase sigma factor [Methanosarcinaceae archaeon]
MEKKENFTEKRIDFTKIEDRPLVQYCLDNNRPAWEEFFRRFIPVIKHAIKNKLENSGYRNFYKNQEIVWDIHEIIVIKLYKKRALYKCKNPSGVSSWLWTLSRNQTIDWIKAQNRKKRLPEKQIEKSTLSLSDNLKGKENLIIEDTISNNHEDFNRSKQNDIKSYLKTALNEISEIKVEQKLWVFRLSFIFYLPFSEDEKEELANFNSFPISTLKNQLDEIMRIVERKEEKRIEVMGKSVLLWYEIRRIEALLAEKEKDIKKINNQEIEGLRAEIEKKSDKRNSLLEKGKSLCRPSNREIAQLVGLPEKKVSQISNILIRARESLRRKLKNSVS